MNLKVVLSVACIALAIGGAGFVLTKTNTQNIADQEERQRAFWSDISERPGIIGDVSFHQGLSPKLQKFDKAIGPIWIPDPEKSNRQKMSATGTLVQLDGQQYLLTALHNIYNPESLTKLGNTIKWGNERHRIIREIDLSEYPEKIDGWSFRIDAIFLPMPLENDLAVEIKSPTLFEYEASVCSFGYAYTKTELLGVSQCGGDLQKTDPKFYRNATTTLDSVKGMSGSPIFSFASGEAEIVGMLVGSNTVLDCSVVPIPAGCKNTAMLLEATTVQSAISSEFGRREQSSAGRPKIASERSLATSASG